MGLIRTVGRGGTVRSIAGLDNAKTGQGAVPGSYWLRLALLCLAGLRLLVAARAPLSADEAYYWVWSRALAAGYLDHPPMVALWIRAGTAVAGDTALGVRLLGPVSALLGSLLLMRAAEDFCPGRRAGVAAAVLLNATLMLNAGAVVMTPDTPLLFFWTAALVCLARLLRTGNANWWLGVGLCAGLALDCKYTAALLGLGVVTWLALVPQARRWFGTWQLWAGLVLAVALFAPVLHWNASHGWASFTKQGGRAADWQPSRALDHLAELVVGQVGLATPGVAWVFARGLAASASGLWRRQPIPGLLACLTLLPAAVFLQHALGDRVQANWPAVIYPGAALAAACGTVRLWRPAAWVGAACAALVYIQAVAAPWPLPRALDFTLIRLGGWQNLAGEVFAARLAAGASYVAADKYGLAAELAWRLDDGVVGVEPRWSLFRLPPASLAGKVGLLVRSARESGGPDPHLWADIKPVGSIIRARGAAIAETYRLYIVRWAPVSGRAPGPVLLPAAHHAPRIVSPP